MPKTLAVSPKLQPDPRACAYRCQDLAEAHVLVRELLCQHLLGLIQLGLVPARPGDAQGEGVKPRSQRTRRPNGPKICSRASHSIT